MIAKNSLMSFDYVNTVLHLELKWSGCIISVVSFPCCLRFKKWGGECNLLFQHMLTKARTWSLFSVLKLDLWKISFEISNIVSIFYQKNSQKSFPEKFPCIQFSLNFLGLKSLATKPWDILLFQHILSKRKAR